MKKNCILLVGGLWFALLSVHALINPKVQPSFYYDSYLQVLNCRVVSVNSSALTVEFEVMGTSKGEAGVQKISLKAEDPKLLGDILSLGKGQNIVAFVGRKRPASKKNDIIYYAGGGKWFNALLTEQPDRWQLVGNADEGKGGSDIMFGVFNGAVEQLWKMTQDMSEGRVFFPATPNTAFSALKIGQTKGPGKGVAVYDLNRDGLLDIIATSPAGNRVLIQEKGGSFADQTDVVGLGNSQGQSISIGDVNNDGKPDLLIDATLFLNSSNQWKRTALLPELKDVLSAAFVELNGDGKTDIVVSLKKGGLRTYINESDDKTPAFRDATVEMGLAQAEPFPQGTGYFEIGDWNLDGRSDLLYLAETVVLLLNDGKKLVSESVQGEESFVLGTASMGSIIEPGKSSALIVGPENKILIDRYNEKPRNILKYGNEIQDNVSGLLMTLVEDFNADGYLDIYATTQNDGSASFYVTNRGYGSFMIPSKYMPKPPVPSEVYNQPAWGLAAGDLNSDGANDLVVTTNSGEIILLVNDVLKSRPLTGSPSDTSEQRKQIQTKLLTVQVEASRGLTNTNLLLIDSKGRPAAFHRLGSNVGTGCMGPSQVTWALRESGVYKLMVTFGDGSKQEQTIEVTADQPRSQSLRIQQKQ